MTERDVLRRATLDDLLEEFKHAMRRKFETQREKARKRHGVGVVDPDFDWSHLNHQHLMDHLVEETREWEEAELSGESTDVADEDVDVANMAFLDWVFHALMEAEEGYDPSGIR